MKCIGLYAKRTNPDAIKVAEDLCLWLQEKQIEVWIEEELGADIHAANPRIAFTSANADDIPAEVEVIVVLGGDGTLISVARSIGARGVPILGVNLGSLGFLTEITLEELYSQLEMVIAGNFSISERIRLECHIKRDGDNVAEYDVLNDVVINKGALARIIDIEIWVGRDYLTTFKADGLIISSPTGSTGYNMAAGGPIVYPGVNCLMITPICPHMLTNRPIIVSDRSVITVRMRFDNERVFCTADGQVGMALQGHDVLEIKQAQVGTSLIKSATKDYFEVLRTKLRWGER
ncbi:MAG: NAD(+)/NADH kinase [Desulfuromonadaceae bacterium]|nr:NAD(+)/NADH kinase [Geobacteraceae bacterium]